MLAGFLRYQAVVRLPVDRDEGAYLTAAFRYQEMLTQKRWKDIPNLDRNMEHPPFIKLIFATDLWFRKPQEPHWASLTVSQPIPPTDRPAFDGARLISAVGGTLQVFVLALVHPLAGLLLAFNTYHIKYSAEAGLEGVSGLMAVLAAFLFEMGRTRKSLSPANAPHDWKFLAVSAIALGLAAAGKYLYGTVGIVLAAFMIDRRRSPRTLLLYGLIALSAFVVADPFLWPNPYSRLWDSVSFHWRYAHSGAVASAAMPWYSPVVHLIRSQPTMWHPGVFYTRLADVLLLPLSLIGLRRALHERPVWVVWAGVGLLFLLLWPTKWPQYILLILPPLAVSAGIGLEQVARALPLPYHSRWRTTS